jgi:hypothetical protein
MKKTIAQRVLDNTPDAIKKEVSEYADKLTVNNKVSIVANCDEVTLAVKMLIALMDDSKIENHVTIDYEVFNQKYKLQFSKVKDPTI